MSTSNHILFVALVCLSSMVSSCRRELSEAKGVKAVYDQKTGRLTQLSYDANHNGRPDSVAEMDGTRIRRIQVDTDENGVVDRWDYYDEQRRLTKIGWSRKRDGVEDAWTYRDASGEVSRIEIAAKRKGRIDRVEFYAAAGVLARVEEDTNGDGKTDKWETYAIDPGTRPEAGRYAVTSTAYDSRGKGIPERRFIYGAGGKVVRVDIADAQGQFATAAPTGYPAAIPAAQHR